MFFPLFLKSGFALIIEDHLPTGVRRAVVRISAVAFDQQPGRGAHALSVFSKRASAISVFVLPALRARKRHRNLSASSSQRQWEGGRAGRQMEHCRWKEGGRRKACCRLGLGRRALGAEPRPVQNRLCFCSHCATVLLPAAGCSPASMGRTLPAC